MLYTWMNCWKKEEAMEWITLEKIKIKKLKSFFFSEKNLLKKQTLENTKKMFSGNCFQKCNKTP